MPDTTRMQYKTLIVSTALLSLLGCETTPSATQDPAPTLAISTVPNTAILWVNGIGCPGCIPKVEEPMMKLQGVEGVSIALQTGMVTVQLNADNPATREQLEGAIKDGDFTLTKIEMPQ